MKTSTVYWGDIAIMENQMGDIGLVFGTAHVDFQANVASYDYAALLYLKLGRR